ncbi:MAG: Bax inhibitor-1/YccA family protein [Oscillospiraceae bacterium]|jgi:FtsH-binding integral membrane protein|nr:Bax inhibitor-1/YccA family protein [Oscillospiraceae bacterium]
MEERNINQYDFDSSYAQAGLTLNQYVARTFGWMFVGLMITFLLAAVLAMTGAVIYLFVNPYIPMVLLIAELVVVLVLSAGILKRPVGVTRVLFAVYSILNGLVFSAYFVIYDVANLVVIFGLTALFFGAFSLYGRFTKTDLSKLRPLLIGGLIFLLVAGLLTMFLNLSSMERIICMVGIVVFLCFTAYDVQKIKANYEYFYGDAVLLQKASIYSALQLYLDFINLFLYLLRFLGRGRNSR